MKQPNYVNVMHYAKGRPEKEWLVALLEQTDAELRAKAEQARLEARAAARRDMPLDPLGTPEYKAYDKADREAFRFWNAPMLWLGIDPNERF